MNTNDEILKLTAERDALREALEEVCRCERCNGRGNRVLMVIAKPSLCWKCAGTGRDYHGSEKAKRLLDGGR